MCSPQLLHTVDLRIQQLPHLRSLAHFLLRRAAGSVRRLTLDLGFAMFEEEEHEAMALLAVAATAGGGLEELDITIQDITGITLSSWLLPLGSSLRCLRTGEFTSTTVRGSLEFLTALQDLELAMISDRVVLTDDARLPLCITRLALGNGADLEVMPPQVAAATAFDMKPAVAPVHVQCSGCPCPFGLQIGALRNLRHLCLRHPYGNADSYAALAGLALETVELLGVVTVVPACLSALTTLRALAVDTMNAEDEELQAALADNLSHALPHLTRLSYLALRMYVNGPLACLSALTSLCSLFWVWSPEDPTAALPPGGWLAGLHTLAAPFRLVSTSLPALQSAQHLEQLCLYREGAADSSESDLRAVIRWAARHPALRRLLLGDRSVPGTLWADIAMAIREHPSLTIEPTTLVVPGFD